jgi:hypothetical protein
MKILPVAEPGSKEFPLGDLHEGVPIFDEDGALSREFLLARGFCCGNGCRNCPYDHVNVPGSEASKQS